MESLTMIVNQPVTASDIIEDRVPQLIKHSHSLEFYRQGPQPSIAELPKARHIIHISLSIRPVLLFRRALPEDVVDLRGGKVAADVSSSGFVVEGLVGEVELGEGGGGLCAKLGLDYADKAGRKGAEGEHVYFLGGTV
jgi:hypothetical protein